MNYRETTLSAGWMGARAALAVSALLSLIACGELSQPALPAGVAQSAGLSDYSGAQADLERLKALRAQRLNDKFSPSFSLGAGDVIEVSVPDVPELKQQTVRVSPEQTITLPVAGIINVQGMTEETVSGALRQRLEKYVRDPEVDVFVKEYHSRQVAVMGMVQKPGFYTLMSRSETLLEELGRAGGVSENASARLIVVPASPSGDTPAPGASMLVSEQQSVADRGGNGAASDGAPGPAREQPDRVRAAHGKKNGSLARTDFPASMLNMLRQSDPIVIDLSSVSSQSLLEIPARPGDAMIVPAAGEVMVDGWVQSPGAYKIVPGMSALSAVAAAGGALFSSTALVLRTDQSGKKSARTVDLSRVRSGTESDVAVQAGDVVFVQRSVAGAVPYAIYQLFTKFGTGMYVPVP